MLGELRQFMHQGEIHIFRVTSFLNLGHSGLKWNRGLFLPREVSVFCVFTVLLVTSRPRARARPIRDLKIDVCSLFNW